MYCQGIEILVVGQYAKWSKCNDIPGKQVVARSQIMKCRASCLFMVSLKQHSIIHRSSSIAKYHVADQPDHLDFDYDLDCRSNRSNPSICYVTRWSAHVHGQFQDAKISCLDRTNRDLFNVFALLQGLCC